MAAGAEHLERFGGHTAAAGLTVTPDNIEAFRRAFLAAVRRDLGEPPYTPVLRPDLEIDADHLSLAMVADIERLGPFGQKNPEPLFVARKVSIRAKKIVGQHHLKLTLGNKRHDAIAFRLGELGEGLPDEVDVAFRIERNSFRGRTQLQLRVEDLRRS